MVGVAGPGERVAGGLSLLRTTAGSRHAKRSVEEGVLLTAPLEKPSTPQSESWIGHSPLSISNTTQRAEGEFHFSSD